MNYYPPNYPSYVTSPSHKMLVKLILRGVPDSPAPYRRFFKNPVQTGFVLKIRSSTGFFELYLEL